MDILGRLGTNQSSAGRVAGGDDAFLDQNQSSFFVINKGKRRNISSRSHPSDQSDDAKERKFKSLCFATPRAASVFDRIVGAMDERWFQTMKSEEGDLSQGLLELAHRSARSSYANAYGGLIQTGLMFGSHHAIFHDLKHFLESNGCRVALLSPSAFVGKTVSYTLEKIAGQLSKDSLVAAGGVSSDDLVAWYRANVRGKREPLVFIVESVETTQSDMLQDLVHVLHECCPRMPHLLLLGLRTTTETLADAIPHSMIDRYLCCYKFETTPVLGYLERFAETVMFTEWPGALVDFAAFGELLDLFHYYEFSVGAIFRGIRLALVDFLVQHPYISIVEGSFGTGREVRAHFESLEAEDARKVLNYIGVASIKKSDDPRTVLHAEYEKFRRAWEAWRLAASLLTHAAALTDSFKKKEFFELLGKRQATVESSWVESLLHKLNREVEGLGRDKLEILHAKMTLMYTNHFERSEWRSPAAAELFEQLSEALVRRGVHSSDEDGSSESESEEEEFDDIAGERMVHGMASTSDFNPQKTNNRYNNVQYHGKDSRKSAILSSVRGAAGLRNEMVRRQHSIKKSSYASKWMAILCVYLLDVLKTSPFDCPASRLFTFDLSKVKDMLVASTRQEIQDCLKHPKRYYRESSSPTNHSSGGRTNSTTVRTNGKRSVVEHAISIDASDEDTCIAFSLYDQDGSCSNLVDWYLSFEDIISREPRGRKTEEQVRIERFGRFSQSLQDLAFIGMISGSRKRAGDHVQRNVFCPDL